MRKIIFILLFFIICFFIHGERKDKIVILNFKSKNVSKELTDAITENIITAFPNYNKYQVIERLQLDLILKELKLLSSEDFNESQVLKIGEFAKAKLVLVGSLTKIGGKYAINARCVDVETGGIVIAKNIKAEYESDLLQATEDLAKIISEADIKELSTKEKVVILNLKAVNYSKKIADAVTENLITAVVDIGAFRVIERSQLDKIFQELSLTSSDDFSDANALEVGKLAKAKLILIGSLEKRGNLYVINSKCINLETGGIVIAKKIEAKFESGLFVAVEDLAKLISSVDIAEISKKEKIVILDLKAINFDKEITNGVTNDFITEIVNQGKYLVLERAELNEIFEELEITSSDVFTDANALEIGKLSKASLVFIGSITKLGDNITINIRGIDIETGNVKFGKKIATKSQDGLLKATKVIAKMIASGEKGNGKIKIIDIDKEKKYRIAKIAMSINGAVWIPISVTSLSLAFMCLGLQYYYLRLNQNPGREDTMDDLNGYGYRASVAQYARNALLIVGGITLPLGIVACALCGYFNKKSKSINGTLFKINHNKRFTLNLDIGVTGDDLKFGLIMSF